MSVGASSKYLTTLSLLVCLTALSLFSHHLENSRYKRQLPCDIYKSVGVRNTDVALLSSLEHHLENSRYCATFLSVYDLHRPFLIN